jgi:translation initiation factor IF-2
MTTCRPQRAAPVRCALGFARRCAGLGLLLLGAWSSVPARAVQDGVLDPATIKRARGASTALGGPAVGRAAGAAADRFPLAGAGAPYRPLAAVRPPAPAAAHAQAAAPARPGAVPDLRQAHAVSAVAGAARHAPPRAASAPLARPPGPVRAGAGPRPVPSKPSEARESTGKELPARAAISRQSPVKATGAVAGRPVPEPRSRAPLGAPATLVSPPH